MLSLRELRFLTFTSYTLNIQFVGHFNAERIGRKKNIYIGVSKRALNWS